MATLEICCRENLITQDWPLWPTPEQQAAPEMNPSGKRTIDGEGHLCRCEAIFFFIFLDTSDGPVQTYGAAQTPNHMWNFCGTILKFSFLQVWN